MQNVIITGAGSGVGRACSLALLKEGFRVILAGRTSSSLEETKALSGNDKDNAIVQPTDVSNEPSVQNLFKSTSERYGRVDVLFNNAGIAYPPIPLDEIELSQWQEMIDINLTGAFLCTREAYRAMKDQDPQGGRIINNGSISAHLPRPHSLPYVASKSGVTGLTKSLMLDGRANSIACSQIDIGNASTDMTGRMSKGVLQADGSTTTEPTIPVQHIAEAVTHLAKLPLDANIPFMTVMANQMPYAGRG